MSTDSLMMVLALILTLVTFSDAKRAIALFKFGLETDKARFVLSCFPRNPLGFPGASTNWAASPY